MHLLWIIYNCQSDFMLIYCDMDGVLVHQTGRDGFDVMPWAADGKDLWEYIKSLNPTVLSQLSPDIYLRGALQKRVWCSRELGVMVPLIVVRAWYYETAKFEYSEPGAVLIDDPLEQHRPAWVERGGVFIHHRSAKSTIARLEALVRLMTDCAIAGGAGRHVWA